MCLPPSTCPYTWSSGLRHVPCIHQGEGGVASFSMSPRISMRLSRPHRYPSSRFPSAQGVRWSRVWGGGSGTVLPKSIIHTRARPEASWTNSKELPTTWWETEGFLKCVHLQGKVLSLWNITSCVPEMKIFWPRQEKDFTTWKEHSSPRVSWRTLTSPERCVAPPASADNSSEEKKKTVQDNCNYPLPVSGFGLVNTAFQFC